MCELGAGASSSGAPDAFSAGGDCPPGLSTANATAAYAPQASTFDPDLAKIHRDAPPDAVLFAACTQGSTFGDNMLDASLGLAKHHRRTVLALVSFPSAEAQRRWTNRLPEARLLFAFPESSLRLTTGRSLATDPRRLRAAGSDARSLVAIIGISPGATGKRRRGSSGPEVVPLAPKLRLRAEGLRLLGPLLMFNVEGGSSGARWLGETEGSMADNMLDSMLSDHWASARNSSRCREFMDAVSAPPGHLSLLLCGHPQVSLRDALQSLTGIRTRADLERVGIEVAAAAAVLFYNGTCAAAGRRFAKVARERGLTKDPAHKDARGCIFWRADVFGRGDGRPPPPLGVRCPGSVRTSGRGAAVGAAATTPTRPPGSPSCLRSPQPDRQCIVCGCCANCAGIIGIGCSGGGFEAARTAARARCLAPPPPQAEEAEPPGWSPRLLRYEECGYRERNAEAAAAGGSWHRVQATSNGEEYAQCRLRGTELNPDRCPHHAGVEDAACAAPPPLPPSALPKVTCCRHRESRIPGGGHQREGSGCYSAGDCVCFHNNRSYEAKGAPTGLFGLTEQRAETSDTPCPRCGSTLVYRVAAASPLAALGESFATKLREGEKDVSFCWRLPIVEQGIFVTMRDHWMTGIAPFIKAAGLQQQHKRGALSGEDIQLMLMERAMRCREDDPYGRGTIAAASSVRDVVAHLTSKLPSYAVPPDPPPADVAARLAAESAEAKAARKVSRAARAKAPKPKDIEFLVGNEDLQRERVRRWTREDMVGQLGASSSDDTYIVLALCEDGERFVVRWIDPPQQFDDTIVRAEVLRDVSHFAAVSSGAAAGDVALSKEQRLCVHRLHLRMRGEADAASLLVDSALRPQTSDRALRTARRAHMRGAGVTENRAAATQSYVERLRRELSTPGTPRDESKVNRLAALEAQLGQAPSGPVPLAVRQAVLLGEEGALEVGLLSSPTPAGRPEHWRVHTPAHPRGLPTPTATVRLCRERWMDATAGDAEEESSRRLRARRAEVGIAVGGYLASAEPARPLPTTWAEKLLMEAAAEAAMEQRSSSGASAKQARPAGLSGPSAERLGSARAADGEQAAAAHAKTRSAEGARSQGMGKKRGKKARKAATRAAQWAATQAAGAAAERCPEPGGAAAGDFDDDEMTEARP